MQLSASSLRSFVECRRCFYLEKNHQLYKPRGPFPSLPGGVDAAIKKKLDAHRGSLPPELRDIRELDGWMLFDDAAKLASYRNWKSKDSLKYRDIQGNVLVGALDDILMTADRLCAPFDYKTKGSEPSQDDCEKYYTLQLDTYALMLAAGGYSIAEFGALFYFWPEPDQDNLVRFKTKVFFLTVSAERALSTFKDAITCLSLKTIPAASADCEFCRYHEKRQIHD